MLGLCGGTTQMTSTVPHPATPLPRDHYSNENTPSCFPSNKHTSYSWEQICQESPETQPILPSTQCKQLESDRWCPTCQGIPTACSTESDSPCHLQDAPKTIPACTNEAPSIDQDNTSSPRPCSQYSTYQPYIMSVHGQRDNPSFYMQEDRTSTAQDPDR